MSTYRLAYILTTDINSKRTQFSKNILEKIGFTTVLFQAFPHSNKLLSHKLSMIAIYNIIALGSENYVYVFEDDINILEDITVKDIIEYEKLSPMFFYLGMCAYGDRRISMSPYKINDREITIVHNHVRGLHALGISKKGAKEIAFTCLNTDELYVDIILESMLSKYPAIVMRYDLESYIPGHRGVIFQDRNLFPTTI